MPQSISLISSVADYSMKEISQYLNESNAKTRNNQVRKSISMYLLFRSSLRQF